MPVVFRTTLFHILSGQFSFFAFCRTPSISILITFSKKRLFRFKSCIFWRPTFGAKSLVLRFIARISEAAPI